MNPAGLIERLAPAFARGLRRQLCFVATSGREVRPLADVKIRVAAGGNEQTRSVGDRAGVN
ncbi:MAG: hypothetical protein AAFR38_14890, partial [Planctomycetota bacterium]